MPKACKENLLWAAWSTTGTYLSSLADKLEAASKRPDGVHGFLKRVWLMAEDVTRGFDRGVMNTLGGASGGEFRRGEPIEGLHKAYDGDGLRLYARYIRLM